MLLLKYIIHKLRTKIVLKQLTKLAPLVEQFCPKNRMTK